MIDFVHKCVIFVTRSLSQQHSVVLVCISIHHWQRQLWVTIVFFVSVNWETLSAFIRCIWKEILLSLPQCVVLHGWAVTSGSVW